jgi:hypothetical protein
MRIIDEKLTIKSSDGWQGNSKLDNRLKFEEELRECNTFKREKEKEFKIQIAVCCGQKWAWGVFL